MRTARAALAVIPALAISTASASPVLTRAQTPVSLHDRPSARAAEYVAIDPSQLLAARTAHGDTRSTIDLELLGRPARLSVERVARRSTGATSVFARVNDDPDSSAVITIYQDAVSARFEHPQLGAFVIEPTNQRDRFGDPLHLVIEIDPTAFAPCGFAQQPAEPPQEMESQPVQRGLSVIDQMVVYTPAVRSALGGHPGAIAFCQNAVDITNQAYLDSEIDNVVLNLVHVQQVDYTESGNTGTDVQRLRLANDGFIDEIPITVRNAVAADNVAMIVNGASNACGTAASINPSNANLAFSVSVRNCAIGNLTFPHEIGHTMGCSHDRAVTSFGWFPYSFGHVFTINGGGTRRTIMATSSGSRIARFSNPDITFAGGVPGAPIGQSNAAHNAEAHRQTGSQMAGHRDSLGCTPFAILAEPADTNACVGESVSLSVDTFEDVPGSLTIQWRFNGLPIPGATSETLEIPSAQPTDSGLYDCIVSNACIDLNTMPALVTISSPSFSLSPQPQIANLGDDVTFTASFEDPTAQLFWERDGQLLVEGLGSDTLNLTNISESDAGVYVCRANTACGVFDSDPAALTISGGGCSPADLAEPFDVLDFSDVLAFLTAFAALDPVADLSPPLGTFDFSDVLAFISDFSAGCP